MFLDKLLEIPKKKALHFITLIGLIAFVVMTMLGGVVNVAPAYGILDYEFAWTSGQVEVIFNAWGAVGMQQIAFGIYIDFLYIIAYGALIFGCLLIVTRKLEGRIQTIGLYMTITPVIAGICDVIENINLLLMIADGNFIASASPFVAALCATIKFTIIFACILFFLVQIILIVIKRKK